jgi:hypothetical protein
VIFNFKVNQFASHVFLIVYYNDKHFQNILLNLNLEDLDSYSDHSVMLDQNTVIIRSNMHDNIYGFHGCYLDNYHDDFHGCTVA